MFKRWVALEGNKKKKTGIMDILDVGSKNSQGLSGEQLGVSVSCLEKTLRYVTSFATQAVSPAGLPA